MQLVKEMSAQLIFLLGYIYKMIAIYLRKQEALHADVKAIQQISFTGYLQNNSTILFINEEAKEIILDFSQGTVIAPLILL